MKTTTVSAALVLQGREIFYEWTRKKVKNLNLRIRPDKSIAVSSPRSTTQKQIEAFLTEKANFIFRALDRRTDTPAPPNFCEGETLPLLGRAYTLRFSEDARRAYVDGDCLFLPSEISAEKRSALVKRCIEAQMKALVISLCEEIYPDFRQYTVKPQIRFRAMKRTFANCRPTEHTLTFSTRLIFYPPRFIRFVVMHEFTHFIVPNHSPAFYQALYERMPDAKEAKAISKEIRPYF